MNLQTILQLAGLLGYLIGTVIIIKFQKNKSDALKTQIEVQNGILSNAEKIINIFKPEVAEGYVSMMEKKFTLEKEEAMRKLNEEWQSKENMGINNLSNEFANLLSVFTTMIFAFPYNPTLIRAIESMKDTITKKRLSSIREEAEKAWKAWGASDVNSSFGSTLLKHLINAGIYPFPEPKK